MLFSKEEPPINMWELQVRKRSRQKLHGLLADGEEREAAIGDQLPEPLWMQLAGWVFYTSLLAQHEGHARQALSGTSSSQAAIHRHPCPSSDKAAIICRSCIFPCLVFLQLSF